jgi:hypothetical protein
MGLHGVADTLDAARAVLRISDLVSIKIRPVLWHTNDDFQSSGMFDPEYQATLASLIAAGYRRTGIELLNGRTAWFLKDVRSPLRAVFVLHETGGEFVVEQRNASRAEERFQELVDTVVKVVSDQDRLDAFSDAPNVRVNGTDAINIELRTPRTSSLLRSITLPADLEKGPFIAIADLKHVPSLSAFETFSDAPGVIIRAAHISGVAGGSEIHPPDPPRHPYALIRCPKRVVAGVPFDLVVGLAGEKQANVTGDHLSRPPGSEGPYTLTVQIAADRFDVLPGETSLKLTMEVTADRPNPVRALKLVPRAGGADEEERMITVFYSVRGQPMGFGACTVTVAPHGEATEPEDVEVSVSAYEAQNTFDLTIQIVRLDGAGRIAWSFISPHIDTPSVPEETTLEDPKEFARLLIDDIATKKQPQLWYSLIGQARIIASAMAPGFKDVWSRFVAKVQAKGIAVPRVLILSDEPYVPWELAEVEPRIDQSAGPFLGAQTYVGRWMLRGLAVLPPAELHVGPMRAIWGVYTGKDGWRRLQASEEEGEALENSPYNAKKIDATIDAITSYVASDPADSVLHFALHGIYDPNTTDDGLKLVDGNTLDSQTVTGFDFPKKPFVFLNACQVGAGSKVLGQYGGLAHAFLRAGARAVVAPLWSVDDRIAKDIALDFHRRIRAGAAPAQILRDARARFSKTGDDQATYLAYQFFGSPNLSYEADLGQPDAAQGAP